MPLLPHPRRAAEAVGNWSLRHPLAVLMGCSTAIGGIGGYAAHGTLGGMLAGLMAGWYMMAMLWAIEPVDPNHTRHQ